MALNSFAYTLQHILMMKLLAHFKFSKVRTVHNLLFLATVSARTQNQNFSGFFNDFFRTRNGVYSFMVQKVIADLQDNILINDGMAFTKEGQEFYSRVSFLLRYDPFSEHCLNLAREYRECLWAVDHVVVFHPSYREARHGARVELKEQNNFPVLPNP